jgi:lipoprotein-releasing system permease protein
MARYQKIAEQRQRNAKELEQQRFEQLQQKIKEESSTEQDPESEAVASLMAGPGIQIANNAQQISQFDPEREQRTGIVLGINLGSIRGREPDGTVEDFFFLRPGDDVQVTFPNAGTPPRGIDETFTIVDFYESKMSEYDSTFAFVPLEKLQHARGMIDPQTGIGSVTSIQVKLKEGVDLNAARDALRDEFPPTHDFVEVRTWQDTQGPLLAAVQLETTILNILLFMIIAVAGFGILATFFMIVVEKTRDIGVLKSLGATGTGIATIFLGYGVLLGTVGAGVGLVCGLIFVWKINDIARMIEWITGREVFDPTVYYFDTIPTIVHPSMLVWVTLGAILIAVLASVLPSIRAARMHPVEALRYE